jgi:hypothetical protein
MEHIEIEYWKHPSRTTQVGDVHTQVEAVQFYRNGSADVIERIGEDAWKAWHLRQGHLSYRTFVRSLVYDKCKYAIDRSYA